ncbi:MAG: hypothetical protein Q4C96_10370 [Planctomycetia bacterium]|nr:hypothetical protein [Planctomycetia bacterium]
MKYQDAQTVTKLTIIVPYNGKSESLEDTLVSLLENRPSESEILVILNNAYENIYELREDEVRFIHNFHSNKNFETAVETAVQSVNSDILHIVPCGSRVRPGWTDAAIQIFDDPNITCVIPVLYETEEKNSLLLAQGFCFSYTGDLVPGNNNTLFSKQKEPDFCVPHPFGIFLRREAYLNAGGLDHSFGGALSIIDLVLRTRKKGGKIVSTSASALQIPREMLYPDGPDKTSQQVKRLFWRWFFAPNPFLGLLALLTKCFSFSNKKTLLYKKP